MDFKSYDLWKRRIFKDAAKLSVPITVMFELTSRCNLNCKMCYVHNFPNQTVLQKELSTEQWKKIMDDAIDCGMLFATLTGGECLLRSDFKELYLYLFYKGIHLTVLSNGLLMSEDYISFFSKYPPKRIQVSLYGSNNDFYERVTGIRAFDVVFKNLLALKQLKNTKLNVSVTPSRYLYDDYNTILHLCKNNNLQLTNNNLFLSNNRDDDSKSDYKLSVCEIVELEKSRHLMIDELTPLNNLPKAGGDCDVSVLGTGCNAGNCSAFVSWDGYMSPCLSLLICREPVLELGFKTAWERTAQCSKEFSQPVECNGCAYSNVCFHCPEARISIDNKGHCNPFTCQLTVEKCKAGIFKKL